MGGEDLLADGLGDTVGEGELEVLGHELLHVWAADVLGLGDLDDLEDLYKGRFIWLEQTGQKKKGIIMQEHEVKTYVDASEARAVAGSHVLVEGLDGIAAGHVAVLLVHVVGAGARVVADPDAKVLDLLRTLLMNLQAHY